MSLGFRVTAAAGSVVLPVETVRRRLGSGPDVRTPERAVEWAQCAGCGHASVTGVRRACGSGAHPRHWGLCVVFGSVGSGLSALSWAAYGWCPVGGGGGVAAGGGSGDGEFPVVDCAVVEMADQYEVGQVGGAAVAPRSDVVGDAAVRGYGAAGIHAAGPVAYGQGGALGFWWRTVARTRRLAVASGWGRWGSPRRR